MHRLHSAATAVAVAALLLAQAGTGGYLGTPTPAVPGTHTPEQSPATAVQAPPMTAAPQAGSGAGPVMSQPSPGLSFGAAPAPIVSPNR